MREKVLHNWYKKVIYTKEDWQILRKKRAKATKIIELLLQEGIRSYVFGSVARGDVHPKSDIDIVIFNMISPFKLEYIIEQNFKKIYAREIVQATPKHSIKGHIYIDQETVITFPLTPFTNLEYEFYRFGGIIKYPEIKDERKRVLGIDKRLVLIIPREWGHEEESIIGRETEIAKLMNLSLNIIKERIRVLTRRDKIGRTGVFIKLQLDPEGSFDTMFKKLIDKNPAVKRMLRKRGLL